MNVYLAEFIGTAIIIFFGGGVVANVSLTKSKAQGAGWMVITAAWALGIATAVYTVGWISGAHLNPALSIALAVIGALKWEYLFGYIAAQILGAMFGSLLVFLTFKLHFDEEENQEALLAIFCTGPAIRNYFWNCVTEILATAMFVFGVLGIGNAKNTAVAFTLSNGAEASGNIGILGGLLVGFLVWAIGMSFSGIFFTNSFSTLNGVVQLSGTSPMRWLTRNTCVSTAIAALLNTTDWMTLAVFLPTPGNFIKSSRLSGT